VINLAEKIRDIPDFPKKGVIFKDITTLLKDGEAFREAVDRLCEPFRGKPIDLVLGIESRGFIFASAVAYKLGVGFIPVRKPGKLPAETASATYQLEYGSDSIEIHCDAIKTGQNILIVDDLIATGGTAKAACELVEKLGGNIFGIVFLIELTFLKGKNKLKDYEVFSIIEF
jgi:adenine phosphoribosyltransferase